MDEASIIQFITTSFDDVSVVQADGNYFFFEGPSDGQKFPIITLATNDRDDQVSNLQRPGIYRLNIGLRKPTFQAMFPDAGAAYDYTALDQIMPHPVYGKMYWCCVLNPSMATFETVKDLLLEAYEIAVAKREQRDASKPSDN